jgi:hypothetical protein
MVRLLRPQGYVVDALRRYDPNLDIRWSWEKRKWAIVVRPLRPELIPAPIRYAKTSVGWVEEKLPERSEAAISYRTETMPVGYFEKITWSVLGDIIENDTWRKGRVARQLQAMAEKAEADRKKVEADRRKEAWKYLRWRDNKYPHAAA